MKTEHGDYDIHTFQSGSDTDTSKDLLGATNNGKYVRLRNGRIRKPTGPQQVPTKIGGELVVYTNNLPSLDYKCLVERQVNQYHVEVWADTTAALDPLIRVNGVIVLRSPLFPVTVADPPQHSFNENTFGGEIGLTALSFTPLLFNVKDMVDSLVSNPNKYFSNFNPEDYSVNLYVALDIPVFQELVNVGGGGGRPVGLYDYAIRYTSDEGDKTNISVATPLIPVMQNLSSASPEMPFSKTYGGPPNPTSKTRYAPKIRFRVTNLHNYQYIEVIRKSYNQGAGLGFTPTAEIIAKIAIAPGEVSWRDFVDPSDSNLDPPIPISDATETQELAYVEGAKSMRYLDRRLSLMNVILASKVSELTFLQLEGKYMHPVVENLGQPGFSDPWNFVHKKHYMGGEKFSWGVTGFDGTFGQGFAQKITPLDNYQIPNRRNIASAVTQLYSYGGTVKAATTDLTVNQTHEVFDLTSAHAKTDLCSFRNIYQRGDAGTFGWKTTGEVTDLCVESRGEIKNHGAHVPFASGNVYPAYFPYRPTGTQDPDADHNYIVNPEVSPSGSHITDSEDYRPVGFGPNYYSHGVLLPGIQNFPPWMKSFSIGRTDAAGRVLAQGIGAYAMTPAIYNTAVTAAALAGKEPDKVWFFCPDIENGIVSSDVVNDLIDNPQNYSVQFVSPLGFFSEIYNFEAGSSEGINRDGLIDMIAYARIVRDTTVAQINVGEDASMGYDGADGYRYPGYGKWRNTGQTPPIFGGGARGDNVFQLAGAERITEGRGTYIGLKIQGNIYGRTNTGGVTDNDFDDQGLKDWTEPVYIINIVRTGAEVVNQNIQQFRNVHYQKLESIIGRGNGLAGQRFELVDERWEDCISALDSAHPTAATDRFLYIKKTDGTVEKWWNVTFQTPAQRIVISNFIQANGSWANGAQGAYTHENELNRLFTIVFDQTPFYPENLSLILVRYDDTAPIRMFGGDSTVGETIFAPIDRESDAYDDAADKTFSMGIGLPYREWRMNPRHYVVKRTTGINRIQDATWLDIAFIRQLCMMFCVESRAVMPYSFNLSYPLQYFPLINYVMRPNRWDDSKSIADQNIYKEYVDDYGEIEKTQWAWGGFRFIQTINHEYSNEQKKKYLGKPDFGFVEKKHFPTREMHSLPRAINVQDSPGLRTFPANNAFDIDDNSGEIKYAYAEINDKGENLYAITEKGICLLLTNKSILSDLNGAQLAYLATTAYVKGQYWIDRTNGMNDQMWRSAAEGSVPIGEDQGGGLQKTPALMWANFESAFLFVNNQVIDNGKANYYNEIKPYLDAIRSGILTHVSGFYDQNNQEYWLHIYDPPHKGQDFAITNLLVYSPRSDLKCWTGNYDYRFDRFAMAGKKAYATRDGQTFELDNGNFIINGDPVSMELTFVSAPNPAVEKEYIGVNVNTDDRNQKPTRIEFLDRNDNLLCAIQQILQGPYYIKYYDGWHGYIPRKDAAPRDRVQYRLLQVKIIHDLPQEFTIHTVSVETRKII